VFAWRRSAAHLSVQNAAQIVCRIAGYLVARTRACTVTDMRPERCRMARMLVLHDAELVAEQCLNVTAVAARSNPS
jgi:hypothetical protein